ncbi:MAG: hypothetical protein RRA94_16165, partial [Bacteroidota bacterium]|nr:hypothetical protein [Bacteroidota bacterium]
YASLRPRPRRPEPELRAALEKLPDDAAALATVLHNDFEDVVMERHPAIRALRDHMLDCGAAGALMSGSGSSVFGLFHAKNTAEDCARRVSGAPVTALTAPDFFPMHIVRDA